MMALKCTILAPAGPRKARMLTNMHRDEKAKQNQFYDLLNKMFKEELLRDKDVCDFQGSLSDH